MSKEHKVRRKRRQHRNYTDVYNNGFSTLPEVVPPQHDYRLPCGQSDNAGHSNLPEVVLPQQRQRQLCDEDKEVPMVEGKEAVVEEKVAAFDLNSVPSEASSLRQYSQGSEDGLQRKHPKLRRWSIWLSATVVIVVVLLALGFGLGEGLSRSRPRTPSTSTGGSTVQTTNSSDPSQSTFIAQGPLNGTAIGCLYMAVPRNITTGESFNDDGNGYLLIYQHSSGELRWMANGWPNTFRGGSKYDVVATDARNSTPISVRNSRTPARLIISVFYVNQYNILSQRSIDNLTYIWTDGPINDLNIEVFDADRAGLLVGYYGGPIENVDLTGTYPLSGLRLWVATDETTFAQYAWRFPLPQWHHEWTWTGKNGHANPATYGWLEGSTTYVWFIDMEDTIELWWMDTSLTERNTEAHPLNSWTRSSISIANVDPGAGLFFHANLYGKVDNSDSLHGWNMSFAAENSTLEYSTLSQVNETPMALDTHLAALSLPDGAAPGGTETITVWCQAPNGSITMLIGDVASGSWNSSTLPLPYD